MKGQYSPFHNKLHSSNKVWIAWTADGNAVNESLDLLKTRKKKKKESEFIRWFQNTTGKNMKFHWIALVFLEKVSV